MNGEQHEALPLTLEGGLMAMMSEVKQEAEQAVGAIPGATVEDNIYCVSIHFRNCGVEDWPQVCSVSVQAGSPVFMCTHRHHAGCGL